MESLRSPHSWALYSRYTETIVIMKCIFIIASHLLLLSCTTISIYGENGAVEIHERFGFPVVKVAPHAGSTIIETTITGLGASSESFVIGYLNESYLVAGKDCEVVLFYPSIEEVENLKSLLSGTSRFCTIATKEIKE
jgi:hypothetical protein